MRNHMSSQAVSIESGLDLHSCCPQRRTATAPTPVSPTASTGRPLEAGRRSWTSTDTRSTCPSTRRRRWSLPPHRMFVCLFSVVLMVFVFSVDKACGWAGTAVLLQRRWIQVGVGAAKGEITWQTSAVPAVTSLWLKLCASWENGKPSWSTSVHICL